MNLKISVLEDDDNEFKVTEDMLKRFFNEANVDFTLVRSSCAKEFFASYDKHADLIILDILLKERITGMDIAKRIRQANPRVAILFITSSLQYAVESYEIDAVNYIIKPLSYDSFFLKMKKVLAYLSVYRERKITLKFRNTVTRIPESEIYYVEVIAHNLIFHTVNGEITVRGPLVTMEKQFSPTFARSSTSYLVNLSFVKSANGSYADVNGTNIPITGKYREEFMNSFYAFIGAM